MVWQTHDSSDLCTKLMSNIETVKRFFLCSVSLFVILFLSVSTRNHHLELVTSPLSDSSEGYLERARQLTSESVQSHALAMIAKTQVPCCYSYRIWFFQITASFSQEQGEQKLLTLKKQMSALVASRAEDMSERAEEAWADVKLANHRLKSLRKQIVTLKQDAQAKRLDGIRLLLYNASDGPICPHILVIFAELMLVNEKIWRVSYFSKQKNLEFLPTK